MSFPHNLSTSPKNDTSSVRSGGSGGGGTGSGRRGSANMQPQGAAWDMARANMLNNPNLNVHNSAAATAYNNNNSNNNNSRSSSNNHAINNSANAGGYGNAHTSGYSEQPRVGGGMGAGGGGGFNGASDGGSGINTSGLDHLPRLPDRIFDKLITGADINAPYSAHYDGKAMYDDGFNDDRTKSGVPGGFDNYDPHFIRLMYDEYRLMLASQYVEDALLFRSINFHVPDVAQVEAERVTRWWVYIRFMQVAAIFFMTSVAFERLTPGATKIHMDNSFLVAAWAVWAVLVLDNLLLVKAQNFHKFYKNRWNRWYTYALVSQVISLTVYENIDFVWLRVGRVIIVLCKLEEFQPQVWAIIKTFPDSVEVLVIYAVIASFYALSGEVLFGNLYRDLDTEYTKAFLFVKHNDGSEERSEWPRFWRSFVSLFVASTTENYPGIMYPAFFRGNHILAAVFFVSFMLLFIYLILNILLAKTYSSWKAAHTRQLLQLRVKRYHALLVAWQVLQEDGNKKMDRNRWKQLVSMIKPEVTDSDQALMFSFMDRDRSGGITRKEFVLHSCDALRFDFAKWRRHEATKHRASGFLCCYDVVISDRLRGVLNRLIKNRWFGHMINTCLFLHTLILANNKWAEPNGDDDTHSNNVNLHKEVMKFAVVDGGTIRIVECFLAMIFFGEQLAKLLAYPPFEFWPVAKKLDLFLVIAYLLAIICKIADRISSGFDWSQYSNWQMIGNVAYICLMLRFLTINGSIRRELEILWKVRFVMVNFVVISLLVFYIYTCVGISILNGDLPEKFVYDADDGATAVDDAYIGQSVVVMNTYGDCYLALLQIAVDNNWQDILWSHIISANLGLSDGFFVSLYFCSFFVLVGWFTHNILVALIIETYDIAKSKTISGGPGYWDDEDDAVFHASTDKGVKPSTNVTGQAFFDASFSNADVAVTGVSGSGAESFGERGGDDGTKRMVAAASGREGTCMRCGPDRCAVFVPNEFNSNICQCGHAAIYHVQTNLVCERIDEDGRDRVMRDDSMENEGINEEKMFQERWDNMQDTKGLEMAGEVPQYVSDFSVEGDLQDVEVMAQLESMMDKTLQALNQDKHKLVKGFKALVYKTKGRHR